jgi:hypothetical protein
VCTIPESYGNDFSAANAMISSQSLQNSRDSQAAAVNHSLFTVEIKKVTRKKRKRKKRNGLPPLAQHPFPARSKRRLGALGKISEKRRKCTR